MKSMFIRTLSVPPEGQKVYNLSQKDIEDISRLRDNKEELDPGMGGVSPVVLDSFDSELVSIDFAITSVCNFRCIWCYRPCEEWGKMYLEFDVISRAIKECIELGVKFFILTGGEPVIYEDRNYSYFDVVNEIYRIYGEKEVKIFTFTDVAVIDEEIAEKFAKNKISLCLKRDALDHELQDTIIGIKGGSLKMEKGYENLFKAGYGKNPELSVSVNTVLAKNIIVNGKNVNTLDTLIDLHQWVVKNGMEHSIVPIHYCGEADEETQEEGINPLEIKVVYDIICELDRMRGDEWRVFSAFPKNKTCNRPGRGLHIRATGKVSACSESPLVDEFIFGDIRENSVIDIVRSKKFQEFKGAFDEREGKYICNSKICDLRKNRLCRGGCATRSAYSRIDPLNGLIVQNEDPIKYSEGREDPLCPGWAVLAQKQGVLKEKLYENIAEKLILTSQLSLSDKKMVKDKIVAEFGNLKND